MPAEDDILTEAGGITAGSWYANPAGYVGVQLVVAGALIMASGRTCSGVWNMGSIMPALLALPVSRENWRQKHCQRMYLIKISRAPGCRHVGGWRLSSTRAYEVLRAWS
jgi:hypothetical protein